MRMNATRALTEAYMRHLEYELRAGWRLGYDYAYVWHRPEPMSRGPGMSEQFSVTTKVKHTNDSEWHPPDATNAVERYDLRELSRDKIRAVQNGRR